MANPKNEKIILAELEYFFQGQFSQIGTKEYGNPYYWGVDSVRVNPDGPAVEIVGLYRGGFQIKPCSAVTNKKSYLNRMWESILAHLNQQGISYTERRENYLEPDVQDHKTFIRYATIELEGTVEIWLHKIDPNFLFITWK